MALVRVDEGQFVAWRSESKRDENGQKLIGRMRHRPGRHPSPGGKQDALFAHRRLETDLARTRVGEGEDEAGHEEAEKRSQLGDLATSSAQSGHSLEIHGGSGLGSVNSDLT
jgi:hypothetical protein